MRVLRVFTTVQTFKKAHAVQHLARYGLMNIFDINWSGKHQLTKI